MYEAGALFLARTQKNPKPKDHTMPSTSSKNARARAFTWFFLALTILAVVFDLVFLLPAHAHAAQVR
jgi:hypothetical protein